jgi:diacylglycerol O-acyltransferase / wax synthase
MVPVNVRSGDAEDKLGNRIVSLFIELPVDESEPLRRYQRVVQETRRQKEGSQGSGASALLGVSELLPPVLHATLSRSLFATRLFNVTITNVAGPAQPHYAMGAEMKEVIPLVPLAAEHALGIAVVSYAGGLVFGLNADHDAVPDLDVLAGGIRDEIATLRRVSDVGT